MNIVTKTVVYHVWLWLDVQVTQPSFLVVQYSSLDVVLFCIIIDNASANTSPAMSQLTYLRLSNLEAWNGKGERCKLQYVTFSLTFKRYLVLWYEIPYCIAVHCNDNYDFMSQFGLRIFHFVREMFSLKRTCHALSYKDVPHGKGRHLGF